MLCKAILGGVTTTVTVRFPKLLADTTVIFTVWVYCTPTVKIGNVVEFSPSANVTNDGTITELEFEINFTLSPPFGAFCLQINVPWVSSPPITIGEDTCTTVNDGKGTTVNASDTTTAPPPVDADTDTGTFEPTSLVTITNVVEFEPRAIVTFPGTLAALLLTDNNTNTS
jgi:hypothetical protein